MNLRMDGGLDGGMDGWKDGGMDGWMDGRMDPLRLIEASVHFICTINSQSFNEIHKNIIIITIIIIIIIMSSSSSRNSCSSDSRSDTKTI